MGLELAMSFRRRIMSTVLLYIQTGGCAANAGSSAGDEDPLTLQIWHSDGSRSPLEGRQVLRRNTVGLAVVQIAIHRRLPVFNRNDVVLLVQVQ